MIKILIEIIKYWSIYNNLLHFTNVFTFESLLINNNLIQVLESYITRTIIHPSVDTMVRNVVIIIFYFKIHENNIFLVFKNYF
jgi:hypothetical protein